MKIEDGVASAILASGGDAVVATDDAGLIRVWNRGAERIFGHRPDEAVGKSLDLIIPERHRARHWAGYHTVMRTGISRYGDGELLAVPGRCKDGRQISVEFTIVPLKDGDGKMIGMAALMRDVTKRFDEMKALRQKLATPRSEG